MWLKTSRFGAEAVTEAGPVAGRDLAALGPSPTGCFGASFPYRRSASSKHLATQSALSRDSVGARRHPENVLTRNLSPATLARVLRAAAEELDRIAAEDSADRVDWIDQSASPLGRKRHCAAVRTRVARGLEGAAVIGRRHLLSQVALGEVLAVAGVKPTKEDDPARDLRSKLRLVGGAL